MFYLIALGFHRQAAEMGARYLDVAEATAEDYVAIGSALRRSGRCRLALEVLERARLGYPRDRAIGLELAHVYLDQERFGIAADLFAQVAAYHPDVTPEAAELQRRAGRLHAGADAERRHCRPAEEVPPAAGDPHDRHAALGHGEEPPCTSVLSRHGLLEDEDTRYALAYALFKAGDFAAAEQQLAGLSGGELFRKATELRKAMQNCRDARWKCLSQARRI
ncbi:MAG: hypothetical protein U5K33_07990 [Halofilum sp. (in: g-proteobacteria)]|nr:hypothetical protein [Halofilum sp. (in: g-proteobacteria)]